ncbi:MAG: hypothetical protein QMD10_10620 [Desulfitobacteriaceae bacterium]|nr:hypothetical protein [Desulfitobacteriaceae bacterium]
MSWEFYWELLRPYWDALWLIIFVAVIVVWLLALVEIFLCFQYFKKFKHGKGGGRNERER